MEILSILLIGAGTGFLFALISMALLNSSNSEKYPVGGLLPSLLLIADFGIESKIIVAGILMMGGITGFYLTLTFWKERPASFLARNNEDNDKIDTSRKTDSGDNISITVKGKSLADFI